MVKWQVILSKQAKKDAKKIASSGLKPQAQALLEILQENPYQPPYEKLVGNLAGYYSRRINIQHRVGLLITLNFLNEKRSLQPKLFTHKSKLFTHKLKK
ncbi:MAG: Txe/YoeB family addiction module toxin [Pleurocapsa sp. MO_226.B13]|nr:Txe/YoeB family addiction module toxin [Pleurocapsa sp. MO_226.B13]